MSMSFGENYRSVRSDGVPMHTIDILPGSQDEAEFLRRRGLRIASELSRLALNSNSLSFDWFRAPYYDNDTSFPPEASYDTREIAPIIHLSERRRDN